MIILNKKNMTKILAAAAAVGAAAATTAIVVKHRQKKKDAEALKALPKGRNIYFLGNSLSALFSAAYLIHDFGFRGDSIHIFGKYAIDDCGSNENGFVCYDSSIISAAASDSLFDILKNIPSRDISDISVKTEIENYNNAYPLSSTGRLYGSDGDSISKSDRKQLVKLLRSDVNEKSVLGDIFSSEFFSSDFYTLWQSMFAIDKDTSANELKKLLAELMFLSPAVENCEGTLDTCINKHECIYEPLRDYLVGCGVEFCDDIIVKDIDFDNENKNVSAIHILDRSTLKTFYLNKGDLCFMTPCSIYEGMTKGDINTPAPAYTEEKHELWNKLYSKRDGIGTPSVITESPVISFTVTMRNDEFMTRIFDATLNSPGTLLTFKDSKWDMSLTCPMGGYFAAQNDDVYVFTGRILNCCIEGDYVKKAAVNASGSEILYELVCQLGMESDWDEILEAAINVIPVLMPFGKAAVSAQNAPALAPMFPYDSENFAMLGSFVKSEKAFGDLEYYAVTSKEAVYNLLKRKINAKKKSLPMFMDFRIAKKYGI